MKTRKENPDFAIYSKQILTPDGLQDATVVIKDGIIADIMLGKINTSDFFVEDVGDLVVMPGLIDSHVHINEPGRTEWEGFETMTKAAIAGGITTLVDMPLNSSPVTISVKNISGQISCNTGKTLL